MPPTVAALQKGFRQEGDVLVYVTGHGPEPGQDGDWFFDELRERAATRLLVDARDADPALDRGRSAIYRRFRELNGRRVAVLGRSRVHEALFGFLLAATGYKHARYFTDEAAARAWLAEAHA